MKTRTPLMLGLALAMAMMAAPAVAAPGHTVIPSAVPSTVSPAVNNGEVYGIAQTGTGTATTTVIGGTFSSVTAPGGAATARSHIAAFYPTTGALRALNPTLNGDVQDVLEGPTAGTVYVAGNFTTVNGVAKSHLVLLDATTGALVPGFTATSTNGAILSITRAGNRLLLGGNFTTAGGAAHRGLASVNATTGALDSFMDINVTEHHNNTGSGSQGVVGVRDLEATPNGDKLVAIGNFRKADDASDVTPALDRVQAMVVDLGGASAAVDLTWRTRRYEDQCFNWAFDTYMRGLSISPDGSFFVVGSTGGQNQGSLCDTAARFEFSSAGDDVQPTWVNYSGGDTIWGIEITEQAAFVGGHQRWMNNSDASDYAGQGSVPRPGLAALDLDSGMPIAWNPGRLPRGAAVYAMLATSTGLWVGSDTDYIGNYKYKRPKLAFFPLAGGAQQASDPVAALPANVYLGGPQTFDQGNVVYRVNAGGGQIAAVDGGPGWTSDQGGSSPYHSGDASTGDWGPGTTIDGTVPASTPASVFDTELWSPSDNPPLTWTFPVAPAVQHLQVRLFFANGYDGTSQEGQRSFDVTLEGQKVLDNFDIVAAAGGDRRGTMKSFDIDNDGSVNIQFGHRTENPLVNAIEIVDRDKAAPAPAPSTLATIDFNGTTATGPTTTGARGIDWANARGAFLLGNTLFYGKTDGFLYKRTFTTSQTGAETRIDPYNDPLWVNAPDGVGGTERGGLPDFYGQLSSLTGMFYSGNRVYYTLSGDGNLYWRWFNADSGIIGSQVFTASAGFSDSGGLFKDGNTLYVVSSSTGVLNKVPFTNGQPSGPPTLADGAHDWRAKAVFIGPGGASANAAPKAAFTETHSGRTYTVNGSSSTDPDGNATIASYEWNFGDGFTATGVTPPPHTYAADGPETITLKVTDDHGANNTTSQTFNVSSAPASTLSFVGRNQKSATSASPSVPIPATVLAGDRMVLVGIYARSGAAPTTPAGWTLIGSPRLTSTVDSYVWAREATAPGTGSVTTPISGSAASTLTIAAYRGVATGSGGIAAIASSTDAATTQHTSPVVTGPDGSWVVQVWNDKAPAATTWTAPGGVTTRGTSYGAGSGRTSALLVDSNGPVNAKMGGALATTSASSGRAITWTIALKPAA